MTTPLQTAVACWGPDLPDWVRELAEQCEASSQSKVAARLGKSGALVSHVLRNKYQGNMAGVEQLVRGVFMNLKVDCPALGPTPANICRGWIEKSAKFSNENSERVRMFRACNRCPRKRELGK